MLAIDNDESPFNTITYSLLDSANDRFSINATTGAISVDRTTGSSIDFETASSHTITVQASDGTLTDTAVVFIPVADINDNKPIFIEPSYTIRKSEITAIGTTILAVQVSNLYLFIIYIFVFLVKLSLGVGIEIICLNLLSILVYLFWTKYVMNTIHTIITIIGQAISINSFIY